MHHVFQHPPNPPTHTPTPICSSFIYAVLKQLQSHRLTFSQRRKKNQPHQHHHHPPGAEILRGAEVGQLSASLASRRRRRNGWNMEAGDRRPRSPSLPPKDDGGGSGGTVGGAAALGSVGRSVVIGEKIKKKGEDVGDALRLHRRSVTRF